MIHSLAVWVTALRRDFSDYCNRRFQEMGISQGLFYFVLYIGNHPGCSPRELAEALHMDSGHTARSVAKLEQGGFLEQQTNPKDRRAHILCLTEAGQAVLEAGRGMFQEWDEEVMRDLDGESRARLLELLERLPVKRGGISHV